MCACVGKDTSIFKHFLSRSVAAALNPDWLLFFKQKRTGALLTPAFKSALQVRMLTYLE